MSAMDPVLDNSRCYKSLVAWNLVALTLALVASIGSVYLSVGLGLKACPLCFYQRTFAIAAAIVLAMLLWQNRLCSLLACLVTLPLAVSGLGVALFHVYLVQVGKLECPPALFGLGDGPLQSLTVFAALTIVCLAGAWAARSSRSGVSAILVVILVGTGAAWACIASAPPLPPAPKQPYDAVKQPFDMCRPPFRGE